MRCWRDVRLCIGLIAGLAACSAPDPVGPSGTAVLYVIQRGWHTDIGLPVEEITPPLSALEAGRPGVRFLVFGFGDRAYVLNRHNNAGTILRALLPSDGALLLTALSASPDEAFGAANVVTLHVSQAGLDRIEARIWQQVEPATGDEPVPLADGPYPGSTFYAARDTYDGFFTCNTWLAETLRGAGLGMPVAGVLFSGQVMDSARSIAARQAAARD